MVTKLDFLRGTSECKSKEEMESWRKIRNKEFNHLQSSPDIITVQQTNKKHEHVAITESFIRKHKGCRWKNAI